MRKLTLGLIGVAIAAAGWVYASPLWTLKAMRDAADANDAKAISSYVDFDALKADLKADMRAKSPPKAKDLGTLGELFAGALTDMAADGLTTPEAIIAFFKSKGNGAKSATDDVAIERGLSEFKLTLPADQKLPVTALHFARSGLGWKLAGVDLPAGAQ